MLLASKCIPKHPCRVMHALDILNKYASTNWPAEKAAVLPLFSEPRICLAVQINQVILCAGGVST